MFILGTICCRNGSKSVKQKNIRYLHGKPLIAYTIKTAKESMLLNDIIVSTDGETIAAIAKENGIDRIIERPAALASDTASKWPVFIHALETYEATYKTNVDYIVDMDVTVPLKTAADIDAAIQLALTDKSADVIITAYPPERNPYFNMMETGADGYAAIVKQPAMPIVRRQDAPDVYSLCPAAYVVKKESLYKYDHWSQARCKLSVMPRERAIDIDTEFDFKFVEFLMQQ